MWIQNDKVLFIFLNEAARANFGGQIVNRGNLLETLGSAKTYQYEDPGFFDGLPNIAVGRFVTVLEMVGINFRAIQSQIRRASLIVLFCPRGVIATHFVEKLSNIAGAYNAYHSAPGPAVEIQVVHTDNSTDDHEVLSQIGYPVRIKFTRYNGNFILSEHSHRWNEIPLFKHRQASGLLESFQSELAARMVDVSLGMDDVFTMFNGVLNNSVYCDDEDRSLSDYYAMISLDILDKRNAIRQFDGSSKTLVAVNVYDQIVPYITDTIKKNETRSGKIHVANYDCLYEHFNLLVDRVGVGAEKLKEVINCVVNEMESVGLIDIEDGLVFYPVDDEDNALAQWPIFWNKMIKSLNVVGYKNNVRVRSKWGQSAICDWGDPNGPCVVFQYDQADGTSRVYYSLNGLSDMTASLLSIAVDTQKIVGASHSLDIWKIYIMCSRVAPFIYNALKQMNTGARPENRKVYVVNANDTVRRKVDKFESFRRFVRNTLLTMYCPGMEIHTEYDGTTHDHFDLVETIGDIGFSHLLARDVMSSNPPHTISHT